MSIRKLILFLSLLFNVVFIFILVGKIQKPTVRELNDGVGVSEPLDGVPIKNSQVIGEKTENTNLVKVTKVIDGDTIVVEGGEIVRYIGIDTPEKDQECFSRDATSKNEELVGGKLVRLEKDISERDRYQRLLKYVWSGDIFVNEYLVRQGYATAVSYPPDVKYQELFRQAEKEARENGSGLWKECGLNASPSIEPSTINHQQSDIICSTNTYNCSDFKTQAEAQTAFEFCGGTTNDVHKLDRDDDGRVCESLP